MPICTDHRVARAGGTWTQDPQRETEGVNRFPFDLFPLSLTVQNLQNIYDVLKWVFTIFPQFCLGQGLIELCYNQIKYDLTHNFGIDSYVSPFEMNFLGWIFVQLASQGTVLLLLRILLHWDLLQRPRYVLHGSAQKGATCSTKRERKLRPEMARQEMCPIPVIHGANE